jgi:hypothetical protein
VRVDAEGFRADTAVVPVVQHQRLDAVEQQLLGLRVGGRVGPAGPPPPVSAKHCSISTSRTSRPHASGWPNATRRPSTPIQPRSGLMVPSFIVVQRDQALRVGGVARAAERRALREPDVPLAAPVRLPQDARVVLHAQQRADRSRLARRVHANQALSPAFHHRSRQAQVPCACAVAARTVATVPCACAGGRQPGGTSSLSDERQGPQLRVLQKSLCALQITYFQLERKMTSPIVLVLAVAALVLADDHNPEPYQPTSCEVGLGLTQPFTREELCRATNHKLQELTYRSNTCAAALQAAEHRAERAERIVEEKNDVIKQKNNEIEELNECVAAAVAEDAKQCDHGQMKVPSGAPSSCKGLVLYSCTNCSPGYVSLGGTVGRCTPCDAGKYSDGYPSSTCTKCAPGRYQSSTRSQSCIECAAGTFTTAQAESNPVICTRCAKGRYALAGAPGCTRCKQGTFSGTMGAHQCTLCMGGRYSDAYGADSEADCKSCARGTFAPQRQGNPSCSPWAAECQSGWVQAVTPSAFENRVCRPRACPAGAYWPEGTPAFNKTHAECKVCDDASKAPCPAGTFQDPTSGSRCTCVACATGRFARSEGDEACDVCPAGTFAQSTSSTSCTYCVAGKFNNSTGSVATADCAMCAYGSFAAVGAPTCSACPAKGVVCPAGKFRGRTQISCACTDCAAGQYNMATAQTTCTKCAAGQHAGAAGAVSCMVCAVGKKAGAAGQSYCASCQAGTYADTPGARQCTECAPGTFQSSMRQTRCVACPCGKFTAGAGAHSRCTACGAGSTVPTCVGCKKPASQAPQALAPFKFVDITALATRTAALDAVDMCQGDLTTCTSAFNAEKDFASASNTKATPPSSLEIALAAAKAVAAAEAAAATKAATAAAAALAAAQKAAGDNAATLLATKTALANTAVALAAAEKAACKSKVVPATGSGAAISDSSAAHGGYVSLDIDGNRVVDYNDAISLFIATTMRTFGAASLLDRLRVKRPPQPMPTRTVDQIMALTKEASAATKLASA